MSYPRACTAARRLSKGTAPSASRTVASAVARFTRHSRTPGCLSRVFSTRCTQEPHVIPVTSSWSSFLRVVPATSLPHEAGYGRDELLDLAVALAPLEALPDAVPDVVIEEAHTDRLQGCRHRVQLGEDVDAVLVLVDHPLQASDLSLDAPQARLEIFLVHRVPVHSTLLAGNCPHASRAFPPPGLYHRGVCFNSAGRRPVAWAAAWRTAGWPCQPSSWLREKRGKPAIVFDGCDGPHLRSAEKPGGGGSQRRR